MDFSARLMLALMLCVGLLPGLGWLVFLACKSTPTNIRPCTINVVIRSCHITRFGAVHMYVDSRRRKLTATVRDHRSESHSRRDIPFTYAISAYIFECKEGEGVMYIYSLFWPTVLHVTLGAAIRHYRCSDISCLTPQSTVCTLRPGLLPPTTKPKQLGLSLTPIYVISSQVLALY